MKTLKNYLDEYGPGKVKLCSHLWGTSEYVVPYFQEIGGLIYVLDEKGRHTASDPSLKYQLWQEPKKKKTVTLYQWLCEDSEGHHYLTIHQAEKRYICGIVIKRLDHTKMEIEVDE